MRRYSKVSYVYQCVGCDTFAFQPIGRVTHPLTGDSPSHLAVRRARCRARWWCPPHSLYGYLTDLFPCVVVTVAAGRTATRGNSTKFQPGKGPAVPEACPHCTWHFNMGGPFWTEPIHDMHWVGEIKKQVEDNQETYPGRARGGAWPLVPAVADPDCLLTMCQCTRAHSHARRILPLTASPGHSNTPSTPSQHPL